MSSAGRPFLLVISVLVLGELWLFFGGGVLDICVCGLLLVWLVVLCGGGCVLLSSGGSYAGGV